MRIHELKSPPVYFQQVWAGEKNFECRYNDRHFASGDMVYLRELSHNGSCYTGRAVYCRIGYVLSDFAGINSGWVVFSIEIKQKFSN